MAKSGCYPDFAKPPRPSRGGAGGGVGSRIISFPILLCALCAFASFSSSCGGQGALANLFTPTISLTPTITPTATLTPVPPTPTGTSTPVPPTATLTETPTETPLPTDTLIPSETSTITPGPSPTDTRTPTITRTPTRTRIPTRTRTPSLTPTITNTPTITLTPTPPPSVIQILSPGLLSRITSPIKAEIIAVPGDDGLIRIELVGEDGRLIVRQALPFQQYRGRSISFYPTIPFEIKSMAETARFQVVTNDSHGRIISLMSVDLVLLSVGRSEIFSPEITAEPYIVRFPEEGDTITGGSLIIDGLVRPVNNSPIIVELVGENGAVLVTKQFTVAPPAGDLSHTPFQIEIPYKVDGPTPVRLTIRQEGSRIPGTVALSSMLITLSP